MNNIAKHRVGNKSGQKTRQGADNIGICRHGKKKLERFSDYNGEF